MLDSNVSPNPNPSHELRRSPRMPVIGRATLGWTDASGVNRMTTGKYTNVSKTGAAFELRDPLPNRTYINFKCDGIRVAGSGSVRYCVRRNMVWTIGVEFSGGLAWRGA